MEAPAGTLWFELQTEAPPTGFVLYAILTGEQQLLVALFPGGDSQTIAATAEGGD